MSQYEIRIRDLELSVEANVLKEDRDFGGGLDIEVTEVYDASAGEQNIIDLARIDEIMDEIESEIERQIIFMDNIDCSPEY